MTDTTDLIREAAEYVGWDCFYDKLTGHYLFSTASGDIDCPDRAGLHALTGLVEDEVRGAPPFLVRGVYVVRIEDEWLCHVTTVTGPHTYRHRDKDPLIARLGALMQLVEKIGD